MRMLLIGLLGCVCAWPAMGEAEDQPGLLEFMTGYCSAILYLSSDAEGNTQVDYWKVNQTSETARAETLAYVEARELTKDLSATHSKIVFLRSLSDDELKEMQHFAMTIKDEAQRKAFKSSQFRYTIVKVIPVDDGTLAFADQATAPQPGEPPPESVSYTLDEFKSAVDGYLQPTPGPAAVTD